MLKQKIITIKDKQFIKTYSDQEGYGVMREGEIYVEAIDPIEYKDVRIYTEVELPLEEENEN